MAMYGMNQLIDKPISVTCNSSTLIDLAFARQGDYSIRPIKARSTVQNVGRTLDRFQFLTGALGMKMAE